MAKYRVSGPRVVAGVEPGGTLELSPVEAAWLIEAGHLSEIATRKSTTKAAKAKAVVNESDNDTSEGGE